MKILMGVLALFFVFCSGSIDNASVKDRGKVEIGEGLYLKKLSVNGDRIYLLVDSNDKLISTNTACSYTVSTYNSGTKQTTHHTESNSVISQ